MTVHLPRIRLLSLISAIISCAHLALADPDDVSYSSNPILDNQPVFSASIIVQVLLAGIIFTLTSVLLLHLLFTAQYHWPLAPVNFVLQISSVCSLLITQIATIHVVFSTMMTESQTWPYMLDYIAVDVPPLVALAGWSTAELAAWLIMNATTSGLIQITHIQFLTLLYPSSLEKRLIYSLLGPLAIVSAIMELLPFQVQSALVDWANAVRNVCNATLSLLFTLSLVIWGFCVRRDSAWRTDGGTAAFGAGALILAIASTALTFAYVPESNQFDWLLGLSRAVILWQSFLGWWWWVGSGVATGGEEELAEALRREEKNRQKKRERKARRSAQREKAKTFLKGMTGTFVKPRSGEVSQEEHCRSSESSATSIRQESGTVPSPPPTEASATTSDAGSSPIARFFRRWYELLQNAHRIAALKQAAEQSGRDNAYNANTGWGLGSFAMRRRNGGEPPENESDQEAEAESVNSSRRRAFERRPSSVSWWKRWRLQDMTVY